MKSKFAQTVLVFTVLWVLIGLNAYASISNTARPYVKAVYSLPLSLDPIQMNDTASLVASNLLYDGLLRFSPTLQIQGALAESWTTSSDGKTLTFKLKQSIKFHNGSAITGDDVVFSLARAIRTNSKVRKYYDCILGSSDFQKSQNLSQLGIKALDSQTVQITLKYPFPPFLSILAGATAKILPKDLVSRKEFFDKPIGSGPFMFVSRDSVAKQIELARFPLYHAGPAKLEQLYLKETTETDAIADAKSGKITDLANWPISNKEDVFNFGKRIASPVAATWIIGLNSKLAPFNDPLVRHSFRAAFNTTSFRKRFFPDAIEAFGYVPPGLFGHRSAVASEQVPPNKSVSKKKITLVIPEELSESKQMKDELESQLSKNGWNVEVKLTKWDDLMAGYSAKKHQAFLVSMNMDYPDPEFLLRNFESSNPDNFSGLTNSELDSLLAKARQEQDRKRREGLYAKAIVLVDSSAVTVNLFHPRANYWVSNCVEGFTPNILADVYIDYHDVYLKNTCALKGDIK